MKYRMTACYGGGETSQTIDASYYKGPGARNGKEREVIATEPILLESNQNHATVQTDGISTALPASMGNGGGYVPMITEEPIYLSDRKGHNGMTEDGTATTLTAQEKERPMISEKGRSIVRRLVPVECERLQYFPDDWSRYGLFPDGKIKELSDSARYRIEGNSIARPFWKWLTKRISAYYERTPTMGGLFSGQGGFELCWEEVNGPGTARWSSEIEPNAVAVMRYHWPEEKGEST